MRRTIAIAFTALSLTACGSTVDNGATGPSAVPSSGPAMDLPTACAAVDGVYTTLDAQTQQQISDGVQAEARGDQATVKKNLLALRPLFTSVSATFGDTAGKVQDPEVRAALTTMAQAAAQETEFDSFQDFQSLAALLAPAEAVLKQKCAAAGYTLKNVT